MADTGGRSRRLRTARLIVPGVIAIAASFLSACSTTKAPATPPLQPTFTTAQAQNSVQKYVVLDSHTFVYDAKQKRREAHGIPCTVSGEGFSVAYTTPANLRLPVYGPSTSDLSMSCSYEGENKFKAVGVRNLTSEKISNAGASGGFIGTVIAMGIASQRGNKPTDDYTYNKLTMVLNDKPGR